MSNKTTDYINPYKPVATLYKNGLDYIITCMTTSSSSSSCDCDCSDVTVEKLINCVCAYLFSIKGIDASDPDNLLYVTNIRVTVTNAVNGYLDKGSATIGTLRGLESVPVKDISAYFDRLDQNVGDSSMLKTSKSNQQLVLSIGRASFEYWNSKIGGAVVSPWSVYFDGNAAIDTASIPYWVSAAMFGSQFNFWQDNATDSEAVITALYTALGGALVVGAGKVIFGWVPRFDTVINSKRPVQVGMPGQEKREYGWVCYKNGLQEEIVGWGQGYGTEQQARDAMNNECGGYGYSCNTVLIQG